MYNLKTSDKYGHSGAFLVYNQDGPINAYKYKCNTMALLALSYIDQLKKLEKNFQSWFLDNITSMYVTSMHRPNNKYSSHYNRHNAADFVIFPWYLNLYFYTLVRKHFSKQNIYISTYNRHLHFDRGLNTSGIEILIDRKTQKIILPSSSNFYLRYSPAKHIIKIYRGKKARKYKDWLLKYYNVSESPFFSTIESFIKNEFLSLTDKEQKEKDFNIVVYGLTGLIMVFTLFKRRSTNGKGKSS